MKPIAFFIAFFAILSVSAQEFEGKVTYQVKFESKIPNVPSEQFAAMMGSVQDYFYRSGDYRIQGNGTLFQWQLFVRKDNRLYSKLSSTTAVYYDDITMNKEELVRVDVKKNAVTVMGYACDEIVITTKTGVQRYYYHSRFNIDPEKFRNYKFNNWNEYVSRARAIPLKMIIETPQFNFESVATDIKETKLDASLFQLPANITVEKSPF